jgi:predicted anti-sigma-YlaC factor YlaD
MYDDYEQNQAEWRAEWRRQDQVAEEEEAQRKRNESRSNVPPGGFSGPRRPLFSKALLVTVPLAAIVLFLPPNGKSVDIPVGVHQFVAAVVVSLGSPLLRRAAIAVIVIAVVLLIAGSIIGSMIH